MNKNILAAIVLLPATVLAQDLHKDIEASREIVPVEREVNRLSVSPAINLPALPAVRLNQSERAVSAKITPEITFLQPAAYADTLYTSPYRGYVMGGISPYPFDGMLAAGYRITDTDRVRLSGWMQYDTDNYKRSDRNLFWRNQTVSAGMDLRWAAGRESYFKAAVDYTFDHYNNYHAWLDDKGQLIIPHYWQSFNMFNFDTRWYSNVQSLQYNGGFRYNHSAMARPSRVLPSLDPEVYKPLRENTFDFSGTATLPFDDNSNVGLDADIAIIGMSRYTTIAPDLTGAADYVALNNASTTRGLVTLLPNYSYKSLMFTANVGARLQFNIKSGKVFHVSPEVLLGWNPSPMLAVSAHLTGGVETNSLERMYGVTPYLNPSVAYDFSNVPLASELKVTLGPWHSAYVELFGGYSRANKWLMPTDLHGVYSEVNAMFRPVDMRGFHFGVETGYTYRRLGSVTLRYTAAPSNGYDKGYYLWRDRARHVLDVTLRAHPIQHLDVEVSYQLRVCRRLMDRYTVNAGSPEVSTITTSRNLGNISNLNLGATYHLFEPLSVFVRAQNILNRAATDISLRPNQGFNVMLGGSYQF